MTDSSPQGMSDPATDAAQRALDSLVEKCGPLPGDLAATLQALAEDASREAHAPLRKRHYRVPCERGAMCPNAPLCPFDECGCGRERFERCPDARLIYSSEELGDV